ncbi:MAG: hypothetical protein ABEJ73_06845 [Haloplanus sp.]
MTNNERSELNRRTVLRGLGTVSAIGLLGSPVFSGVGAAASTVSPDEARLYAITRSTRFGETRTQYLIEIDPSDGSAEVVTELNSGEMMLTPSLAFHPDGTLYGIEINPPDNGQVYHIDTNTGGVTLVGSTHQSLRRMFGTTFTRDGVYHGINTRTDSFYSPIDYTENGGGATDTPVEVGDLIDADAPPDDNAIDAVHTGLTTNQATDAIYSTLGNQEGGSRDEVGIVDRNTGEVTFVATDVLAVDQLVGAEFNPCTGELYVVRNGDQLKRLDPATGTESTVGTLTITVDGEEQAVVTDNLAGKWIDCARGCTRTIGYYKTHGCAPKGNNENVVQPLLGSNGIWLGQEDPSAAGEPLGDSVHVTESCAADPPDGTSAEELLDTSGSKEPKDMLLAQLLAAKLNVRDGAAQSAVLETILYADRWLAGKLDAGDDTVEMWKDDLDAYNNGDIDPGHCDEENDDDRERGRS